MSRRNLSGTPLSCSKSTTPFLISTLPLSSLMGAATRLAADQALQFVKGVAVDDVNLVVLVLDEPAHLLVLDGLGALVFFNALAGEHAGVDDDALDSRRHPEAGVLYVAGLFAKDGPEKLLLGAELGLALGGYLAGQDVAGLDLRPDADDAALVQVLKRLLAHVGDVAGDLFLAQLGVPGHGLELLDVHRGEDVLLDDALGDEDGVLVVEPAPAHEGHQDILAQGQLAHVHRRAVGQDLSFEHR